LICVWHYGTAIIKPYHTIQIQRYHNSSQLKMLANFIRFTKITASCIFFFSLSITIVQGSSAAGTETLIGIVGEDFILLGADSSVSQNIALTASNIDKIIPLIDPLQETLSDGKTTKQWQRQQTIVAAAAGDAANSDDILGLLKAYGVIEEYKNYGSDVRWVTASTDANDEVSYFMNDNNESLDVRSMAHFARRNIWERLRSRSPLRICLLIAGMMWVDSDAISDDDNNNFRENDIICNKKKEGAQAIADNDAFASQKVQAQIQRATTNNKKTVRLTIKAEDKSVNILDTNLGHYQPKLYWLDEYGSLQKLPYGVHGHGSNFLLSVLDQSYKKNMSRLEALDLMKKCFQELRKRYVINSPKDPCIKFVDSRGIRSVQMRNDPDCELNRTPQR